MYTNRFITVEVFYLWDNVHYAYVRSNLIFDENFCHKIHSEMLAIFHIRIWYGLLDDLYVCNYYYTAHKRISIERLKQRIL